MPDPVPVPTVVPNNPNPLMPVNDPNRVLDQSRATPVPARTPVPVLPARGQAGLQPTQARPPSRGGQQGGSPNLDNLQGLLGRLVEFATGSVEQQQRNAQLRADGGIPVLPIPGTGNTQITSPNFDPNAGGTVDLYGNPVTRPAPGYDLSHVLGQRPVPPNPDDIASAIIASQNEGSLTDQDAQLVAKFAQSLLGESANVQVSTPNTTFDLGTAAGRLQAVAERERELLTAESYRDANNQYVKQFGEQRMRYLDGIDRYAESEDKLADHLGVYSVQFPEHVDTALSVAENIASNPNSPPYLRDANEGFIAILRGDLVLGEPASYPVIRQSFESTVGEAVAELMDTYNYSEADALDELVRNGNIRGSALTAYNRWVESAKTEGGFMANAIIDDETKYGGDSGSGEGLYNSPLYTESEITKMDELLRAQLGLDEAGNDGLSQIYGGQFYWPETLSAEEWKRLEQIQAANQVQNLNPNNETSDD